MTATATATLLDAIAASVDVAASVPTTVGEYRQLSEAELADVCRLSTELHRISQTVNAVVAGEIAHRSRPELGSNGLAQRHGHRTPEEMVRVTTGATGQDATKAVRIGRLVHEAQSEGEADPVTGELSTPTEPWLAPIARALTNGTLSVAAADAIRNGLGAPTDNVPAQAIADAAARLCDSAATLDPDRLYKRARAERDELDACGIADREKERRERRALRLRALPGWHGQAHVGSGPRGLPHSERGLRSRHLSQTRGSTLPDERRTHREEHSRRPAHARADRLRRVPAPARRRSLCRLEPHARRHRTRCARARHQRRPRSWFKRTGWQGIPRRAPRPRLNENR